MPKVTKKSKDGKLKIALIKKAQELLELCEGSIPEGGHISICAWPGEHISISIYEPSDGRYAMPLHCYAMFDDGLWETSE